MLSNNCLCDLVTRAVVTRWFWFGNVDPLVGETIFISVRWVVSRWFRGRNREDSSRQYGKRNEDVLHHHLGRWSWEWNGDLRGDILTGLNYRTLSPEQPIVS